jgi:membrane fusion protein (multidrug efflux system)
MGVSGKFGGLRNDGQAGASFILPDHGLGLSKHLIFSHFFDSLMPSHRAIRYLLLVTILAAGFAVPGHAAEESSTGVPPTENATKEPGVKKGKKKKSADGGATTEGAVATEKKTSGGATASTDATPKKSGGGAGKKGGGAGGRGGGQVQPVEVTNITRRDLVETLQVVGSVGANETASIRPEMAGIIRSIQFEEGLPVKKGDLLLKIDDQELAAQVAQSKARFELAKQNLERARGLRETQSNTAADLDRSNSEFASAQADLRLLEVRLARTEIRAPFDGVVGSRVLSAGDFINTQSIVTTINDLSRLKAEFQVPERYVAKVKQGTPFTVKSTTGDASVTSKGEVYFVNSTVDRNTRSSEVKGYLTNPPPTVKPGMFAVFEIVLEVRKNALAVPEGAIFVDQRGPQLVVVRDQGGDKVVDFVPVKLGLRVKGVVEVIPMDGKIDERTQVVGAGVGSLPLFAGARVEARPLREEFRIDE